ncbi:Ubiquitin carboxyl-terminal hydrolase 14 [Liparis tanakae]|uniref:ubiquitinyl hydrolase 1 n=1 Tax=Liparis tanakae TaxID=230148 RepID=A0A4Z2HRY9_9TELE|nr:Ubiquitin carboxyl-terminal hydrolase 14 [Liparis tanakae]
MDHKEAGYPAAPSFHIQERNNPSLNSTDSQRSSSTRRWRPRLGLKADRRTRVMETFCVSYYDGNGKGNGGFAGTPAINVKWGKEKFDAIELNTEEPPMVFKAQLFALSGVQPDRQKVMVKGGTLKGMTLLMMGSAEALPEEPSVRPMFVEDMTEEQLASAVSKPEN